MPDLFACDIETTGLSRFDDRILGIGVYNSSFQHFFESVEAFKKWHEEEGGPYYVFHNGSFDVNFLRHHGLDLRGYWLSDTRVLASLLTPRPDSLGLESLTETFLKVPPYKLDRTKMASYSFWEVADYCLKDCKFTFELYHLFLSKLSSQALKFFDGWALPAAWFLADMEFEGVYIDREGLELYLDQITQKRNQVLEELQKAAKDALIQFHETQVKETSKHYRGMYEKAKLKAKDQEKCLRRYALLESAAISRLRPFNWSSPEQLKWLLRDYYKLDVYNHREDKETTNEAKLTELASESDVARLLVDYRTHEKLVTTCIPALLENLAPDGFVHTHYHIGGTRTGRLSSSSPNLQQIPKGALRSYVQASDRSSILLTIDYAQIEVRVIAELAKEKELIDGFRREIDPYSVIARNLLQINCPVEEIKRLYKKERDVSKTAGLSILYGTGAAKLQEVLQKELQRKHSLAECRRFIEDYRRSFPAITEFKHKLERALANGGRYQNLLGRPFMIESNDDLYMKALNTLVQGSASDLVVHAALKIKAALDELQVKHQCRLIIHDELVWELPEEEAALLTKEIIVPTMTTQIEEELSLTVPLKVEYTMDKVWQKP